MGKFHVRAEGQKVLVNLNDRAFLELEPHVALALAAAITQAAKRADEIRNVDGIIRDSAILMRAGAPFSLSSRPRIVDAARSEAAWNGDLRRYMPGGVKSEEVFGLPTIISHAPSHATKG